jgi:hypothetical protein
MPDSEGKVEARPAAIARGDCAGCGRKTPFNVEGLSWADARILFLAVGWGINDEDMSGLCPACMKPADLLDEEGVKPC